MPLRPIHTALALAALCCAGSAHAYPEGAPWGAANPDADESCATCHFDADPVRDSAQLNLTGVPRDIEPGQRYELVLQFDATGAVVAGFQVVIRTGGAQAGTISAVSANVEAIGAAVRSTEPATANEVIRWVFSWQAPAAIKAPVVFHTAALAGNDDGSPLGDTLHYRTFLWPMKDAPATQ